MMKSQNPSFCNCCLQSNHPSIMFFLFLHKRSESKTCKQLISTKLRVLLQSLESNCYR
eukprot:c25863_g1_i1 orf=157-330(+)